MSSVTETSTSTLGKQGEMLLTGASLQEIGREFGGRHHTTVVHSINKIEAMRRSDETLNRTITQLMDAFFARA